MNPIFGPKFETNFDAKRVSDFDSTLSATNDTIPFLPDPDMEKRRPIMDYNENDPLAYLADDLRVIMEDSGSAVPERLFTLVIEWLGRRSDVQDSLAAHVEEDDTVQVGFDEGQIVSYAQAAIELKAALDVIFPNWMEAYHGRGKR